MVIPNLPLPIAGNVTPTQPGASSVAGEGEGSAASSGETGGLFAALLATLEGVAAEAVVAFGENGATPGFEESNSENVAPGSLLAKAVASDGAPASAGIAAELVAASEDGATPTAVPQSLSGTAVTGQAKVAAEVLPATVAPELTANTDPLAHVGRPVNVEQLVVARAPAVPVDAGAAEVAPQPAEPAPQAPLLTGVKGPVLTVPSTPVEQTSQVAPSAELRVLESAVHAAAQSSDDAVAFAKSEPDSPELIDFEKAKQSLSVLRASEESTSTPMRKAIEAFAKPAVGHSDVAANAPRPQPPALLPVVNGESSNAPVADVTRATPLIAPAELGADAPKAAAAPEAPARPTRTTLTDIAETAVRSIRYLARNGEHRMTLRLIPESLGEIHIEVLSSKEALSVRLVAESAVARDAMEAQAHLLRDSLSQEGLEVRSITVSEDSGSGRGSLFQRDANASRNGERGQSQTGQESTPDQSSGGNRESAMPRARHEGAFDQVA